jgi:hypothetical protein
MDHRMGLLMAWLEGEGERGRRHSLLPPLVGDPAVRGWVQVGVCVLTAILATGVFLCWLVKVWNLAGHSAQLSKQTFGVERVVTLPGVRVERIAWGVGAGGRPAPLTLIVSHRGLLAVCEFQGEKAPREVRVGDTVSIRGTRGRFEEAMGCELLTDCEMVEERRDLVSGK